MTVHEHGPLTFLQTQTPASLIDRDAARRGMFPGPILPSQQFSIQGGLQQLNSVEQEMLQRVVRRLKRQSAPAAGRAIGGAFGL